MANNFLYDEDGVNSSIRELEDALDSYKQNVNTLKSYISNMSSSGEWQDEAVKTSFIAAAEGYISAYELFQTGIEGYIECLSKKSTNLKEHEANFTK